MRVSYFLVLWYSLDLIVHLPNIPFLNEISNIVVVGGMIVITWLLYRFVDIDMFKSDSKTDPVLEEVYNGNVISFRKRLLRDVLVNMLGPILSFMVVFIILLRHDKTVGDWVKLPLFSISAVCFAYDFAKHLKAYIKLKGNPTPEQCRDIAVERYGLNYVSYYENHHGEICHDKLPEQTTRYKSFLIASFVVAIVCVVYGLTYYAMGVGMLIRKSFFVGVPSFAPIIECLIGSGFIYFGVKDIVSARQSLRRLARQQASDDGTQNITF